MSTTPPLESSSTAAINTEDDDDDFGTFSGFETAASSDMKSDNDGSPDEYLQENAPAASASPPPPEIMSSSSLNEDEFFDAPFEDAGMNQMNDLSNENVENEMNQPEVDMFSSVEDAAIIPPDASAAVESKQGSINDNIVADSADLFSAFDEIAEGGGEQNGASHFNNQQDDVGFGEFEGIVSGSPNDIADMSPFSGVDNGSSPSDTPEPVAAELIREESTSPASDENSLPANHNNAYLENELSAFESHDAPEVDEIAETGHQYQVASDTSPTPADTSLSAFDAFSEIQDAPLPPFGIASHVIEGEGQALVFTDTVTGTTTIDDSGDNFGEFAGVDALENAADENTNNKNEGTVSSPLQNYTTEAGEDMKERETTTEEEVAAPVPETSVFEAAPTNVTTLDAAEEDSGDVFTAFEETSPASDAFCAFSSPVHEDADTAHAEKEQDIPVQDDTALVTEATEKDTAFDGTATEEVDDFGDFTAPNEEDLPVEVDTAFAEEDKIPVETAVEDSDDFGDFTAPENNNTEVEATPAEGAIQESDLDDFGGFAAPPVLGDEALVEGDSPVEADVGVAEQDTHLPEEEEEIERNLPVEDKTALADATEKGTAVDDALTEAVDDFGDLTAPNEDDLPVEMDTAFAEVDTALVENAIDESDDFGDFTAPNEDDLPVEMDTALTEVDTSLVENAIDESDDFGDFTASNEDDLPVEMDTAFAELDTALVENAIDESDDFGDFTAPNEDDLPVEMDTALTEVDKGTALVENAIDESDDFGDFTAPNEDDLPVEMDAALTEVDKGAALVETAAEESVDFCDFTAPENNAEIDAAFDEGAIQESDFNDFGGFAAPPVLEDEALVEGDLPVEEDECLAEREVNDNEAFGDFTAHVSEAPLDELHSALSETNNALSETAAEEFGDFGDFSAPIEVEADLETEPVVSDEVQSNKFGSFTAPVEEVASHIETKANENDEFGDFGGFSSPAVEAGAATNESEGASDDDFGNFGDFSAPVEADTENNYEERPSESHKPDDAPPAVEEEDFGEFGEFAAFDEATAPTENEQNAQVDEKAAEEDIPTPQHVQPVQAVSAEEDEFGDFGDFEESDKVKETSGENEPSRPVHVLNENVRGIFQKVFRVDNPVESEKGDGCVQLPFDVPMRTVLAPRKSKAEEKGDKQTYRSDKEIKEIIEYIESLPTPPPSTILSEEKWYPYSHYVFHHDGTPYTEKTNLMGVAAPSIPEVLSIELPTGFDASAFSPNTSSSSNARCTTPPVQSVRPTATATLVDFPSAADTKMTEEDANEAAEEDDEFDKLSAAGKKFMDKLPDLSYMLQPTLSTVK